MDSVGDVDRVARSFSRHLRTENKSPRTVATYGESVEQLRADSAGESITSVADVRREHVEGYLESLVRGGALSSKGVSALPGASAVLQVVAR